MRCDRVGVESLLMALEDHDPGHSYFLELSTGEVLMIMDDMDLEEELYEKMEVNPEDYAEIEPIPSHEAFQIMANYVETLKDDRVAKSLSKALSHRHPFRSFKDVLLDHPEIREKWFQYHDARLMQLAQEWLEENGIEASLGDQS